MNTFEILTEPGLGAASQVGRRALFPAEEPSV